MKIKVFNHNDLDAVGCTIMLKMIFEEVDVIHCGYDEINERIARFVNDSGYLSYDKIFITDISVNEEVAHLIDSIYQQGADIILIDHHPTSLWLKEKYEWAIVAPLLDNGIKASATVLLHDYLMQHYPEKSDVLNNLNSFSEIVRKFDTWDWDRLNDPVPKKFNDLLHLVGKTEFIDRMIKRLSLMGNNIRLNDQEEFLLEVNQENINRYIENTRVIKAKFSDFISADVDYDIGIVFAEQHISELGNRICNNNPDIDFVIIINFRTNTFSFRSTREDIHLGEIARKYFGGGGHPQAAGAEIGDEKVDLITKLLISKEHTHA